MGLPAREILHFTPFEEDFIAFEFANRLSTGETISSSPAPAVTISPTGPTIGTPTISGTQVKVKVSVLGSVVKNFELTCKITTSLARKLQLDGLLQLREPELI